MIIGFPKRIKPRPPRRQRSRAFMSVTQLEMRLAPATLVGANDVTFFESSNQQVDVHISAPVLTNSNVNSIFTFNTGSVNSSTSPQQLQLLNLTAVAPSSDVSDASVTITVHPLSGTAVPAKVGFINATGIDLGDVLVQGDLGGINAGNATGLNSLSV